MSLDPIINPIQTSWINKKSKNKKYKKYTNTIPANLTVAPLQSIFSQSIFSQSNNENSNINESDYVTLPINDNPIKTTKLFDHSFDFLKIFNMPQITTPIEGFVSYSEFTDEIKPYIDYIVKWGFDKWWIEYPTVFINWVCQSICNVETIHMNLNYGTIDNTSSVNSDDLVLVTTQFKRFLAVIISIFIAYNWYNYLIVLPETGKQLDCISPQDVSDLFLPLGVILYYFMVPVFIFQICMIQFKKVLDIINNGGSSSIFGNGGFSHIVFLLLFGIIFYIVIFRGANITQSFSYYLHGEQGIYVTLFSSIIICYGVFSIPMSVMLVQQIMSDPISL